MSVKWTGIHSESGILRKSEFKEKKEELFVFGYSCKLFRDDDKALHIDQGKHLIPWMGDESLKIDRYDARGALHELSTLEAPPGGFDWRVELTRGEQDVEQLCDEERYRALHTDEDEEEMYKEEELKRLHAAGYGQVGFNYEASASPAEPPPQEVDEPFVPAPNFKALLPEDVILPETQKQNAIIEKTAKFIASQGTQMEILIKAKQGDNPQFQFLNKESTLNAYYRALIALVKADKWPEKPPEVVEEKQPEVTEEYLHPSLASTVIESAPSIPSIAYRPSADCDYTLLVSRLRGSPSPPPAQPPPPQHLRGTPPPPGTAPLALPRAHIVRAPVLIAQQSSQQARTEQYAAYYPQCVASHVPHTPHNPPAPAQKPAPSAPPVLSPAKSTGLSLMKNYDSDTDSDSESSDSCSNERKDKVDIITPPPEVQMVIDKMAAYVARNGDEFAEIVRAKNDPRFAFLEPAHAHHAYYRALMQRKRSGASNGTERGKNNAVVSFSIKKHKEPDPILPKPALPYESSSDDESENSKQDKPEDIERKEILKSVVPEVISVNNMPPVIVYKLEATHANNLPIVKSYEPIPVVKPTPKLADAVKQELKEVPKIIEKPAFIKESSIKVIPSGTEIVEDKTQCLPQKTEKVKSRTKPRERSESRSRDKRKYDRKREHKTKSESRESKISERRSTEREKREKEYERDKKKRKTRKEVLDNEIISLVDNSDDLIDLTGEQSDSKGGGAAETTTARPARAAGDAGSGRRTEDFLRRAGLNPTASLPNSSLASAMVDTLETLRKKREEEEEKLRRREKRRRKDRREHEECGRRRRSKRRKHKSSDEERSDFDGMKKKKRKKDKKNSSRDAKRRRKESELEEDMMPINIDLTSTLKELRTASPTKELGLDGHMNDAQPNLFRDESSEEGDDDLAAVRERRKNKKQQREYSEGEWSSDSCERFKTPDQKPAT